MAPRGGGHGDSTLKWTLNRAARAAGYAPAVSTNGRHHPSRPRIEVRQAAASPEEAAAIAAAIEQFLHDTAPPPAPEGPTVGGWQRAALMEATGRSPSDPSTWGDAQPWGR